MHTSLKTTNIMIRDSAQDIRIVAWVLLVDLVLAAIGHTMVHTVLNQEVKDLVLIVISAHMEEVAEKGHIAYS
jgi:hypothetical protein